MGCQWRVVASVCDVGARRARRRPVVSRVRCCGGRHTTIERRDRKLEPNVSGEIRESSIETERGVPGACYWLNNELINNKGRCGLIFAHTRVVRAALARIVLKDHTQGAGPRIDA